MDADSPLKTLFRLRPADLLPLTGDAGAKVLSAKVVELPAIARTVDFVLKLRRGREVYLRHLEFQMRSRRDLSLRVFEYATRLVAQFRLPVLTTVVFVRRPSPAVLVHQERIGGCVVHERRFDVVRLSELDPRRMMRLGLGGAALVGPSVRSGLATIRTAAGRILRKAPAGQRADLLAILRLLSEGRYTARQLAGVIPEEVVMGSSLFAKARRLAHAEGVAKGRAEGVARGREEGVAKGELAAMRRMCRELVERHHPGIASRVSGRIDRCAEVSRLHAWALAAPEVSSEELVARVLGREKPHRAQVRAHRRAPRPSRRSKSR